VPRFELILDDDARASLAARPKDWVRAEFRYAGTTLGDVGVRWKGNRSRQGLDGKPSWKIRFDKFVPKQRFLGQRELVLNNLVEDPTAVREALAYRLYRDAGVPAPRTGWAQLVVDGANLGLYLNLEAIDRGPLKRVFGDDDGTLYEGEFGCDLYPEDAPRFEQDGGDDVGHADLIALAEVARRARRALGARRAPRSAAGPGLPGGVRGHRRLRWLPPRPQLPAAPRSRLRSVVAPAVGPGPDLQVAAAPHRLRRPGRQAVLRRRRVPRDLRGWRWWRPRLASTP
jgi:hypothetical protein